MEINKLQKEKPMRLRNQGMTHSIVTEPQTGQTGRVPQEASMLQTLSEERQGMEHMNLQSDPVQTLLCSHDY